MSLGRIVAIPPLEARKPTLEPTMSIYRANRVRPILPLAPAIALILIIGSFWTGEANTLAQSPPANGMRPADLRAHAIVGATIVPSPGQQIENGTILIRKGVIEAVGTDLQIPPDARIWDAEGLTVYPGLIESALMIDPGPIVKTEGSHWNSRIHPEFRMAEHAGPDAKIRKELRDMGFTTAAVYPSKGEFRGSGAVISLAENPEHMLAYDEHGSMAIAFDYGGRFGAAEYPGALAGAVALLRQTIYDAKWHAECSRLYAQNPAGLEPPTRADALSALREVVVGTQPLLFEARSELDLPLIDRVLGEFNLNATYLGTGNEFLRLEEIVRLHRPLILPLNFPIRPELSSISQQKRTNLRSMLSWEQAPTNPRRLINAGAIIALTTHKLKNRKDFRKNLRMAIQHGLSEQNALAALTTIPASFLGLQDTLGTIAPGKAANLVVTKGSLFDKKSVIRATWINGRRHESTISPLSLKGTGTLTTTSGISLEAKFNAEKKSLSLAGPDEKSVKAKKVLIQNDQMSFILPGHLFGANGWITLSGVRNENTISGTGELPDGTRFNFSLTVEPDEDGGDEGVRKNKDSKDDVVKKESKDDKDDFVMPPEELVFPLGGYGLSAPPESENFILVGATLWTCEDMGIIKNGVMQVKDGKIVYIGRTMPAGLPRGITIRNINGKHVTPGLIDPHSHTGLRGGVNEWAQANSAEVRMSDSINPDDINWYRELAGGLTAANQLHGSANPMGGQNSPVKIKWGRPARDFPIQDAKPGIKFALGENVKRSTNRYPDTRMGVETYIRDGFTAARAYAEEQVRYNALTPAEKSRVYPPQRDLELDTLVEILNGERLIHCHSYRQDEILSLIRIADDFGFTIGVFQHVLEGYKVAEAIAEHGAGGSTFSDWWMYKMEVMDAIPYNGALMNEVGVLTTFNSDSSEHARRLNTEAAKAVRYGGVSPEEALKFVTINAAKQLRIDHRTGSLAVGKDADFVVWSGDPLSIYTRCEQTWIEGARYFDLDKDRELSERTATERNRLIQKILMDIHGKPTSGNKKDKNGEEKTGEPSSQPEHAANDHALLASSLPPPVVRWMEEQVRRGFDPEQSLPGGCGCEGLYHFILHFGGDQ